MTDATQNSEPQSRPGSAAEVARVAIPVVIACASVALVLVALGGHAGTIEITAGPDEPTPYSAMESRIPPPPQPDEPPPPTF